MIPAQALPMGYLRASLNATRHARFHYQIINPDKYMYVPDCMVHTCLPHNISKKARIVHGYTAIGYDICMDIYISATISNMHARILA